MKKIIFTILIIIIIIYGCNKIPSSNSRRQASQASIEMDNAILKTIDRMRVDASLVQRKSQRNEIHYSIPLRQINDLNTADRVFQEFLRETDIKLVNVQQQRATIITKSYSSASSEQTFVVEFYLHRLSRNQAQPTLCIIIDDFGSYDNALLDAFNLLDKAVTFAVLPGLPHSRTVMEKAARAGREIIVHMPMEAENSSVHPGNNAIFANMSSDAIYNRVKEYFQELHLAVGANNHMGSKITANPAALRSSLRFLSENNLLFVDSRTTSNTVGQEISRDLGISFAERNLFLDAPDNSDEVLYQRLLDLEKLIDSHGRVLVITHCFDRGRLQRLTTFIEEAKRMGFVLVPVSKYVQKMPQIL